MPALVIYTLFYVLQHILTKNFPKRLHNSHFLSNFANLFNIQLLQTLKYSMILQAKYLISALQNWGGDFAIASTKTFQTE